MGPTCRQQLYCLLLCYLQAIKGRGLESTTVKVTTAKAIEYERLIANMERGEGAAADADPDGAAFKLEKQYQLQRLQEAAAMQERARQEARLAKRQVAIQAGVSRATRHRHMFAHAS